MHAIAIAALLSLGAAPVPQGKASKPTKQAKQAKPLVLFIGKGEPAFDQALAKAIEASGRQAREASAEERAYTTGPWAQGQLDVPIPADYPADARADLERGLKACRAQQSKPPSAFNPGPRACASQLAQALWERHLVASGAEALLRVTAFGGGRPAQASLIGYRPQEASLREVTLVADLTPEVATELVERYLRGEGQSSPRDVPALP